MWTSVANTHSTHPSTAMKKLLAPLVLLAAMNVDAQQEVMTSQYMFNGLFLNPAYAGTHSYFSTSLLHRAQWLNVEGAPRTSMFAIDGPLMNEKMGVGFSIVHDEIGVSRDLDMSGSYAYHLRLGADSRLSLGLRAGLSVYSANLNDLVYWDGGDQVYQGNISNQLIGKFGFGLYWYSSRAYVGLSVPTIHAADGNITSDVANALDHYFTQHYYLNAGHLFPLGEYFDVKPSVLVKYQPEAPVQVDVNCNFLYRERFWFGAGYRTGESVVGMMEYQVTPRLRIGYAYDMNTSALRGHTGGSHEVMLGLDLGQDAVRIKTPRHF